MLPPQADSIQSLAGKWRSSSLCERSRESTAGVLLILTHRKRKEQHIKFARLTVVQVKTDKIDEFIKLYRRLIIPIAKWGKG